MKKWGYFQIHRYHIARLFKPGAWQPVCAPGFFVWEVGICVCVLFVCVCDCVCVFALQAIKTIYVK